MGGSGLLLAEEMHFFVVVVVSISLEWFWTISFLK